MLWVQIIRPAAQKLGFAQRPLRARRCKDTHFFSSAKMQMMPDAG
jgi:hypothetical protein